MDFDFNCYLNSDPNLDIFFLIPCPLCLNLVYETKLYSPFKISSLRHTLEPAQIIFTVFIEPEDALNPSQLRHHQIDEFIKLAGASPQGRHEMITFPNGPTKYTAVIKTDNAIPEKDYNPGIYTFTKKF